MSRKNNIHPRDKMTAAQEAHIYQAEKNRRRAQVIETGVGYILREDHYMGSDVEILHEMLGMALDFRGQADTHERQASEAAKAGRGPIFPKKPRTK